jgi:hypothetical protein
VKRSFQTAGAVLVGLELSWLVWQLAIGMAGGGHGWNSSAISGLCVFALPLTGVGFVFPRHRLARIIAGYVTLAAVSLDLALLLTTTLEGWSIVEKIWTHVPLRLTAWAAIWSAWHVAIALLWRKLRRKHEFARDAESEPL